MLFNSIEFLLFFPVVTLLYFLFPVKFRWIILLIASCIFYSAFIPSYLLILLLLIVIDFSAGILIEQSDHKKKWLWLSILANLSLLGVFKYYNFFVTNINALAGSELVILRWILPIGLSFHTFQSLSYTIEVYKGRQTAIRHFGYYALYVMFYPQLVAGPIERPQNLFPQFFAPQKFSSQKLYEGLRLMAWGFFKKVVIADRLGLYADGVFNHTQTGNQSSFLLAVIFFSIQIYADFSGYSDIALGCARCMGIDLMINFRRPYFASNIRDFWQRWHISLSSWFREYVYIPLGGNRKGALRHKFNLLVTFILSGFWHGASWTFVIWGMLHGIYSTIYDIFNKTFSFSLPKISGWLITMLVVTFAWIFFRANSTQEAFHVINTLFSGIHFSYADIFAVPDLQFGSFTLLLCIVLTTFMFFIEKISTPRLFEFNERKPGDILFFAGVLLLIVFFGIFNRSTFIYFQF